MNKGLYNVMCVLHGGYAAVINHLGEVYAGSLSGGWLV